MTLALPWICLGAPRTGWSYKNYSADLSASAIPFNWILFLKSHVEIKVFSQALEVPGSRMLTICRQREAVSILLSSPSSHRLQKDKQAARCLVTSAVTPGGSQVLWMKPSKRSLYVRGNNGVTQGSYIIFESKTCLLDAEGLYLLKIPLLCFLWSSH